MIFTLSHDQFHDDLLLYRFDFCIDEHVLRLPGDVHLPKEPKEQDNTSFARTNET